MHCYSYQNNELYVEQCSIDNIIKNTGTPCYIYSKNHILYSLGEYQTALKSVKHKIHYAVKANSNLAILQILSKNNCGFDVVSLGEMVRVKNVAGSLKNTVFSGVAKTVEEIKFALKNNILCFNVESIPELERISKIAKELNIVANISIRVNPNVDPKTHPYIATGLKEHKFGIPIYKATETYSIAANLNNIDIYGISFHLGSQISTPQPYLDAITEVLNIKNELEKNNIIIKNINIGGGIGVSYDDKTHISISNFIETIKTKFKNEVKDICLQIEPGRSIVANAGLLITKIEYIKQNNEKNFAIVDAGMNDLLRPSLYGATHKIIPIKENNNNVLSKKYDIVGPVCETSDIFAKHLSMRISEGNIIAIESCGAYASSMSSNYNSRVNIPEVLIDGDNYHIIREKQPIENLFEHEKLLK